MALLDRFVVAAMPYVPKIMVRKVASKYIAGESLDDAMNVVQDLNARGMHATVDVLGEFVSDPQLASRDVESYLKLIDAIADRKLKSGVSVKLTAVGLSISPKIARDNVKRMIDAAAKHDIFVRIDMEDSPYTTETLAIYEEFRKEARIGIVVQAYLKRTADDVKRLMDGGPTNIRLCKGIYVEPEAVAFKDRKAIQDNFLKLLELMFDGGALVGIATHDRYLVEQSELMLKARGMNSAQYEYQMLLGVLPELRDEIVKRGHRMRVYVPFGDAWYGYSTRRLKENPALAGYVFKSLFKAG
ncbi:MAG: proline dehydrogenase family protein [Calditrichaeota bacterium]|nr:proline dehydrogenase family protein [Calditrichota bacterium]MCB9367918.1 proline dehydrogenase family protein [Calditrichota bacterium]